MYLKYFNLRASPYSIGCDERFFFESPTHAEALANMRYAIEQRKGMVLITGEVGTGKTFLGTMLAARLGLSASVVMLAHPPDSAKQVLRAVTGGLGIGEPRDADKWSLVNLLEHRLEQLHRRGRLAALILDEAQHLPDDAMEEVRLMWNWERQGRRLLQIVLIGQPELRHRLREDRWASLRQRIVLSYHLERLDHDDTVRYILHRRKMAAYNGCPLRFTVHALDIIYKTTGGVPRLINILCDNALLTAYARDTSKITSEIVTTVLHDMTCWSLHAPPSA